MVLVLKLLNRSKFLDKVDNLNVIAMSTFFLQNISLWIHFYVLVEAKPTMEDVWSHHTQMTAA
jgi:hypothetical protein